MIKLKTILNPNKPIKELVNEGKTVKYHFQNSLPGGIGVSEDINFSVNIYKNMILLTPQSSKELDKIDELQYKGTTLVELLEIRLSAGNKYKVKFKEDTSYQGAGYAFKIDLDDILKSL